MFHHYLTRNSLQGEMEKVEVKIQKRRMNVSRRKTERQTLTENNRQNGRKRRKQMSLCNWKGFMTQNPTVWMRRRGLIWKREERWDKRMSNSREQKERVREMELFFYGSPLSKTFFFFFLNTPKNKPIKSFYYCLSTIQVCYNGYHWHAGCPAHGKHGHNKHKLKKNCQHMSSKKRKRKPGCVSLEHLGFSACTDIFFQYFLIKTWSLMKPSIIHYLLHKREEKWAKGKARW